jgi:hypothetical protein
MGQLLDGSIAGSVNCRIGQLIDPPRRRFCLEGDQRHQNLDGQSVADVAVNTRHQCSVVDDSNLAGVTGRSESISSDCSSEAPVKGVLGAVNGELEIL